MSKTILATCGAYMAPDGYCTAPVYLDHPDDRPRCDACHKISSPRIAGPARMRALADELAAAPEYSHDEEAARLLVYAAAKVETLEALEARLEALDMNEQRQADEATDAFVLRLLDQRLSHVCDLQQRLRAIEAASPLGADQATLHPG